MTESGARIGREMVKGTAWMITMRIAQRLTSLVSTIILARLLVPDDFGLVAIAVIVSHFLDVISEMSIDVVLIQNQRAGRREFDTAWTLGLMRSGATAVRGNFRRAGRGDWRAAGGSGLRNRSTLVARGTSFSARGRQPNLRRPGAE